MDQKHVFIILTNILVVLAEKSLPILNGNDAAMDEAPFMAGLIKISTKSHFCSGAIVDAQWIVTAYHCIKNLDKDDFLVVVGSVMREEGDQYSIVEIISHPGYPKADIALLRTDNEIEFTDNIKPISIAGFQPADYSVARVYGWGRNEVSTD